MNGSQDSDNTVEQAVVDGMLRLRLKSHALQMLIDPLRFSELYGTIESVNESADLRGYIQINDIGYDGPAATAQLLDKVVGDEEAFVRSGRQFFPAHELVAARFRNSFGRYLLAVLGFTKPSVAALQGRQDGEILGVSLAFDMRIAVRDTTFVFNNTDTGLPPSPALSDLMPRFIGAGHTQTLLQNRACIDAEEALSLGLISRVVEDAGQLPGAGMACLAQLETNYENVLAFQRRQTLPAAETMQQALDSWYAAMATAINNLRSKAR